MSVTPANFKSSFTRLRAILEKHAGTLDVTKDTPSCYCLEGGPHPTHHKPMPIAWVKIEKTYVSYHLMPVYGCPALLDGLSANLKARMQGKSCFNFKVQDDALFEELERLTAKGIQAFRKAGFIS